MKRTVIRSFIVLAVVLIALQFVSSTGNKGDAYGADDITHVVAVPDTVKQILEVACYDCHSNHTTYRWYSSVQPVGIWIGHHINEGKEHLNFSEFAGYTTQRKVKKLEHLAEQVKDGRMPMPSYLRMHPEAVLTEGQKEILINWANKCNTVFSTAGR